MLAECTGKMCLISIWWHFLHHFPLGIYTQVFVKSHVIIFLEHFMYIAICWMAFFSQQCCIVHINKSTFIVNIPFLDGICSLTTVVAFWKLECKRLPIMVEYYCGIFSDFARVMFVHTFSTSLLIVISKQWHGFPFNFFPLQGV